MSNRLSWEDNHQTEGTRVYIQNFTNGEEMSTAESQENTVAQLKAGLMLKKGQKSAQVEDLQNMLLELGYSLSNFGADGDFGNETVEALKQFQRDYGLSADGVAGKQTGTTLESLYTGKMKPLPVGTTTGKPSTIPGFSNDPLIRNREQPTPDDLVSEWGLLALITVGVVWYGKENGWFDDKAKKRS